MPSGASKKEILSPPAAQADGKETQTTHKTNRDMVGGLQDTTYILLQHLG